MILLGTIPYHPTTIIDPKTGELKGFYVDTFRDQFKTIGLDVEFVETKWGTFAGAQQSNQFDVFVGGSFATPLRGLALNFRKSDVGRFKTFADIDRPGVKVAVAVAQGNRQLLNFLNTLIDYMNINGKWRNASKAYAKDLGGFFVINPSYESLGGTGKTGMIR